MHILLSLLMLGLWALPSEARINVTGSPIPYLPALEDFLVRDGALDWEGSDVEADLQRQASQLWRYAVLSLESFGETRHVFHRREWDRWPQGGLLYVTKVDLTSQTMTCTPTVPGSPRALPVRTVWGGVWGQGEDSAGGENAGGGV